MREVAASEDGQWLLAGFDDGIILLLDGCNGTLIESWPDYADGIGVEALAWSQYESQEGYLAAAGFIDDNILLLGIGKKAVQTIGGLLRQGSGISALVFNPHGRILATGNNNGELHLLDLQSRLLLGTLPDHQNRLQALAWSPYGA